MFDVAQFLSSQALVAPLRRSDCAPITDGAAAVVLAAGDLARSKIEADNASRRGEAEVHSANVEGKSVVLIRASSNAGQLYGSVSVRDIVDALNADGAGIAKSMVVLERPIKTIGVFDVKVALHPEVTVMVKVNVARSPDEADQQAKGVDVIDCSSGGITDVAPILGKEIKYSGPSGIGPIDKENDPSSAFVGIYTFNADNNASRRAERGMR